MQTILPGRGTTGSSRTSASGDALVGQRRVGQHLRGVVATELGDVAQRPHDVVLDERRRTAGPPSAQLAKRTASAAPRPRRSRMSKSQVENGASSPRSAPSCRSSGRTSASFTAPIVSFSRYGSSGKKTCVTSVLVAAARSP